VGGFFFWRRVGPGVSGRADGGGVAGVGKMRKHTANDSPVP